jgi:hypothetical protein
MHKDIAFPIAQGQEKEKQLFTEIANNLTYGFPFC